MSLILWLVIGGLVGWFASIIMKTDAQQGIFLNVVVGIVGAFLAGFLVTPLLGTGTINTNDFGVGSIAASFLGALVLLGIVNLFRRRSIR